MGRRETLFDDNRAWALEFARKSQLKYKWPKGEAEAVCNAALKGLWDAAAKYDPQHSKFRTYAVFRIIGEIQTEMRSLEWWPRRRHINCPRPQSICDYELVEFLPSDTDLEDAFEWLLLRCSAPNSRLALRLYFGRGIMLKEIGSRLGVTETRAGQLVKAGVNEIKRRLGSKRSTAYERR